MINTKYGGKYIVAVWRKTKVWNYQKRPVLWMNFRVSSSIFLFTSLESSLLPYNKYFTSKLFGRVLINTLGVLVAREYLACRVYWQENWQGYSSYLKSFRDVRPFLHSLICFLWYDSPDVESKSMRYHMLNEHRAVIGKTRAFDGAVLFLPKRLDNNVRP